MILIIWLHSVDSLLFLYFTSLVVKEMKWIYVCLFSNIFENDGQFNVNFIISFYVQQEKQTLF